MIETQPKEATMHGNNRRLMRVEAIRFKMAYLNETVEEETDPIAKVMLEKFGIKPAPVLTTEDFLTIRNREEAVR
jgi:hypothetical protein